MKTIFIILFCSLVSFAFSQEESLTFDYLDTNVDTLKDESVSIISKNSKAKFGLTMGSGYTLSSKGGGSYYSFSPYMIKPVTDKFSIRAGLSYQRGLIYNPLLFQEVGLTDNIPSRLLLFTSADYKVNEKLTLSGTMYKSVLSINNPNVDKLKSDLDGYGGSIELHYKITPNISFGAGVTIDNTGFYNPYNTPNNMGTNMFHPGYW